MGLVPITINENGLYRYMKNMDEEQQKDYLETVYGIKFKWYLCDHELRSVAHFISNGYSVKVKRQNNGSTVYTLKKGDVKQELKIDKDLPINAQLNLFDRNEELAEKLMELMKDKDKNI